MNTETKLGGKKDPVTNWSYSLNPNFQPAVWSSQTDPNMLLLFPCSGPEPPVYWSVCFGGQFFSANVFQRPVLCVDWLVPGARPGEIASLSTISTNPVPPLTCWGPAEHKTPPPWDDACIWRLIGGRVFALYPSPGSHLFSARAR